MYRTIHHPHSHGTIVTRRTLQLVPLGFCSESHWQPRTTKAIIPLDNNLKSVLMWHAESPAVLTTMNSVVHNVIEGIPRVTLPPFPHSTSIQYRRRSTKRFYDQPIRSPRHTRTWGKNYNSKRTSPEILPRTPARYCMRFAGLQSDECYGHTFDEKEMSLRRNLSSVWEGCVSLGDNRTFKLHVLID